MAKAPAGKDEKKPKRVPVTGFAPLKFQDHTITQKRSGRYEVVTAKGKNVNGPEKTKILVAAKLVKLATKRPATAATTAPAAEAAPAAP